MPPCGVALYGPPASGKDTVTAALTRVDPRYVHFRRIKAGGGRTDRYRACEIEEIDKLRDQGLIVYENARYNSLYVIDRPALDSLFAQDLIPIVHLGQLTGLQALQSYPALWLSVRLHCRRVTTQQRVKQRGSGDVTARLRAWDETAEDLRSARADDFALIIDTDRTEPVQAAELINSQLRLMTTSVYSSSRR
jgi:guanylate kinase